MHLCELLPGIAAAFEEQLRMSASTFNFKVGKVIASPINKRTSHITVVVAEK